MTIQYVRKRRREHKKKKRLFFFYIVAPRRARGSYFLWLPFSSCPSKQLFLVCSLAGYIFTPYHLHSHLLGNREESCSQGVIRSCLTRVFSATTTTMAPSRWMLPAALGFIFSLSVFLPSAEAGCCPNACSGHGTCTVDDACVCYSNWQVRGWGENGRERVSGLLPHRLGWGHSSRLSHVVCACERRETVDLDRGRELEGLKSGHACAVAPAFPAAALSSARLLVVVHVPRVFFCPGLLACVVSCASACVPRGSPYNNSLFVF